MASTQSMFDGESSTPEFREEGTQLQKRTISQFRRRMIQEVTGTLTLSNDVGTVLSGTSVTAYKKTHEIKASAISTAFSRKYVCVADDNEASDLGGAWIERVQVWEMRSDWEDYTWPAA
jgi:hypothetical protein